MGPEVKKLFTILTIDPQKSNSNPEEFYQLCKKVFDSISDYPVQNFDLLGVMVISSLVHKNKPNYAHSFSDSSNEKVIVSPSGNTMRVSLIKTWGSWTWSKFYDARDYAILKNVFFSNYDMSKLIKSVGPSSIRVKEEVTGTEVDPVVIDSTDKTESTARSSGSACASSDIIDLT